MAYITQALSYLEASQASVLVKNLRKGPFSARDVKMDDFFYGQENNSLLVSDDTLSNFKRIPEPDCVL